MSASIERRTITGPTVAVGDVRATPESRVVTVRVPFGAFVWNRPSVVVVERGGHIERLPIVDVTRIARVTLWACTLTALLVYWRWPRR